MDGLGSADILEFGHFRFNRRGRCLLRLDQAGKAALVPLGRTALDVLEMLVAAQGGLVEREEIMKTVWRGKTVEDCNLAVQISNLRDSLGRSRIQTISGRGYRFVVPPSRPNTDVVPRPRLSIVVLPFANLCEDRGQQYFADGITDDLTTDLSRLADMFVISRNTAFTYRDKPVDTKQIGRELGVRYVLEGSVRRSGSQVRVNVQLIDAETDAHLWAERFDRDTDDLFALQNEITSRIAVALDSQLVEAEAARPAEHPDALDYILRGRAAWNSWPIRDNYAEAVRLFEQALTLNPESVEAQSWLAHVLATRVLRRQADAPAADIGRAEELIEQALAASPRSTHAHFVKGQVLRTRQRFEEAIPEFETVIASDPNCASAYANLGWCKFLTGSVEGLIPLQERALRLGPREPFVGILYFRIGLAHLLQSHYEDAIGAFEKARIGYPAQMVDVHAYLAAAYALKGETERAITELAEARHLSRDGRYSSIAGLTAVGYFGVPRIRALFEATFFAGLRKAGMPE